MRTISLPQTAASVPAALLYLIVTIASQTTVFSQEQLLKDFIRSEQPNFYNEYSQLTYAGDVFYFVSDGKELWKSDGTPSGTKRVRALRAIQNLTLIGDVLYFSATDGTVSEVWKSDGSYTGTVRVKQIRKGTSNKPRNFISVNNTVFFVADNGTGNELWKTNGTQAGTTLVKDIRKVSEGSDPSYLALMNDKLYFSADDGIHGRE